MGLTGGAAILAYAQSATTHGRLFNFEQYFDANINYYISIRVVTDQIGPLTTFSIKEPMAQGLNQRDRFGDTFISGSLILFKSSQDSLAKFYQAFLKEVSWML